MKTMAIFAALSAAALMGATAFGDTITIDGVTWTYSAKGTVNKTITLGAGSACIGTATVLDAADIPWTMDIDGNGEPYKVTAIANYAFQGCASLTGTLAFPDHVTTIGKSAFKNTGITRISSLGGVTSIGDYCFEGCQLAHVDLYNSRLASCGSAFYRSQLVGTAMLPKAFSTAGIRIFQSTNVDGVLFPGPDTVASGTQTYKVIQCNYLAANTSCKLIFFGPNTEGKLQNCGNILDQVSGCTVFAPANGKWTGISTGGEDNDVVYYGANQPLDMFIDVDAGVVVATPTTEATLVSILKTAPYFGLNVRVNVTNTIEVAAGAITASMLNAVKFNTMLLTFKVNTQEDLDSVFAAVPASNYPLLAIDASDARSELTVPDGREVYVRIRSGEGRQGKYTPKINGIVIVFR